MEDLASQFPWREEGIPPPYVYFEIHNPYRYQIFLDTPIFSLFSVGISDVILNLRTESHWCINSFKLSWEYMDIYLVIEYINLIFNAKG